MKNIIKIVTLAGLGIVAGLTWNNVYQLSQPSFPEMQKDIAELELQNKKLDELFNETKSNKEIAETFGDVKSPKKPATETSFEAWNGTTWGMSSYQVNQLFDGNLVADDYAPCDYPDKSICTAYNLKNYYIGDRNYNVNFIFIKEQLAKIKITPSPDDFNNDGILKTPKDAENLVYLLVAKYGDPNINQFREYDLSTGSKEKKEWSTTTNKIYYSYSSHHEKTKFSDRQLGKPCLKIL